MPWRSPFEAGKTKFVCCIGGGLDHEMSWPSEILTQLFKIQGNGPVRHERWCWRLTVEAVLQVQCNDCATAKTDCKIQCQFLRPQDPQGGVECPPPLPIVAWL
jgi:hypothetical protein